MLVYTTMGGGAVFLLVGGRKAPQTQVTVQNVNVVL